MANKDNQSKEYRIYIKESKSWVDVNKEFYTNYYRDINAYRKRQQEHGRCVCPASKRYLCDMDCMTCPYAKAGDQLSLDNTVSDGEGNEKSWLDDMPDESAAIAALMEDAELLRALYAKLNELDTEGVEPMSHISAAANVFREDVVTNGDDREQILKNAPGCKDGMFKVPRTVD